MRLKKVINKNNEEFNDAFIICPDIYKDDRGFFYESWNQKDFDKTLNKKVRFCQDNQSESKFGVLRGMHFQQKPFAQAKLVRCTFGKVFDVIIDLRIKSKTFGKWFGINLTAENKTILWIPEGFAHGFLTVSNYAVVQYKTDNFWDKESEEGILWNDPTLNISWPLEKYKIKKPILSKKDAALKNFINLKDSNKLFK